MKRDFLLLAAYCSAAIFGLGGFAITLWLGVTALIPQLPWDERNITAGTFMIIFSALIGIVCGFMAGLLCGGSCLIERRIEDIIRMGYPLNFC